MFATFVKLAPSLPKLPSKIWDLNLVLNWIREDAPGFQDLSLCLLAQKTAFLLMASTSCCRADIVWIDVNRIYDYNDHYVRILQDLSKTYTLSNTQVQVIRVYRYTLEPTLCPYTCLSWYLWHTRSNRNPEFSALFLTSNTFKPVANNTVAGWLKNLMDRAGVLDHFTPHSICSSSSSFKIARGRDLEEVLKHGQWKSKLCFMHYYCRQVDFITKPFKIPKTKQPILASAHNYYPSAAFKRAQPHFI